MVIAGVTIESAKEKKLVALGVKDSKRLSPRRREELAKLIEKIAKNMVVLRVQPCKIDSYRARGINLDRIEAMKMAQIIDMSNADLVYVDSLEQNVKRFKELIRSFLKKKDIELIVENYLDERVPVVSAASIPYEEKIVVTDDRNNVKLIEIGKLVEKKKKDNFYTFAFDPKDLKVKKFRITGYVRHFPQKIYEVRLAYGKRIKVTGSHSLFTIENGIVHPIKVENLKIGDYVGIANRASLQNNEEKKINLAKLLYHTSNKLEPIYLRGPFVLKLFTKIGLKGFYEIAKNHGYSPFTARYWKHTQQIPLHVIPKRYLDLPRIKEAFLKYKFSSINFPIFLTLNKDFLWFLGMYAAEGSIYFGKKGASVNITNLDKTIQKKVVDFIQTLNIVPYVTRGNVQIPSKLFAKLMKSLGVGIGARNKRIPSIVFQVKKALMKNFLEGYLSGDGWFADNQWNAKTYSKRLADELQILLLFLGRITGKYGRGIATTIRILSNETSRSPDNIPAKGVADLFRRLRKKVGLAREKICRLANISHDVFGRIERGDIRHAKTIRRSTLRKLLNVFKKMLDNDDDVKRLEKIINSDIAWCKVLKIIDTGRIEPVYDLEVQPNGENIQNFLSCSGVFLHNSIIAKTERDATIEELKKKVGFDFGVGYSHDPATIEFVRKLLKETKGKFPPYVRKSWITAQMLREETLQRKLKDFIFGKKEKCKDGNEA